MVKERQVLRSASFQKEWDQQTRGYADGLALLPLVGLHGSELVEQVGGQPLFPVRAIGGRHHQKPEPFAFSYRVTQRDLQFADIVRASGINDAGEFADVAIPQVACAFDTCSFAHGHRVEADVAGE